MDKNRKEREQLETSFNKNIDVITPDSMFKEVSICNNFHIKYTPFRTLQTILKLNKDITTTSQFSIIELNDRLNKKNNSCIIDDDMQDILLQEFLNWLATVWNFYIRLLNRKPNRLILPINTFSLLIKCLNKENQDSLNLHIRKCFDSILIEEYTNIVSVGIMFYDPSYHISLLEMSKQIQFNHGIGYKLDFNIDPNDKFSNNNTVIEKIIKETKDNYSNDIIIDLSCLIDEQKKKKTISSVKELIDSMKSSYQYNEIKKHSIDLNTTLVLLGGI